MLRCMKNWWHGCLGNARRDWKYYRKLEQILKTNMRKHMQKILRIFTRIHLKSMKFIEKSFQKVPWGSQVARIVSKGRQGTAKGKPRGAKMAPRRPKGSPRWRQEGLKGGQMRSLGPKRSEKGFQNRCQGRKNSENADFATTMNNL